MWHFDDASCCRISKVLVGYEVVEPITAHIHNKGQSHVQAAALGTQSRNDTPEMRAERIIRRSCVRRCLERCEKLTIKAQHALRAPKSRHGESCVFGQLVNPKWHERSVVVLHGTTITFTLRGERDELLSREGARLLLLLLMMFRIIDSCRQRFGCRRGRCRRRCRRCRRCCGRWCGPRLCSVRSEYVLSRGATRDASTHLLHQKAIGIRHEGDSTAERLCTTRRRGHVFATHLRAPRPSIYEGEE
mmetsp:Transcript_17240/g.44079  ORF Transcript_17240/g.44079 Transcript_17240/m.44079 type:complete len:246 (+) Transcript_17240:502-1239(+)